MNHCIELRAQSLTDLRYVDNHYTRLYNTLNLGHPQSDCSLNLSPLSSMSTRTSSSGTSIHRVGSSTMYESKRFVNSLPSDLFWYLLPIYLFSFPQNHFKLNRLRWGTTQSGTNRRPDAIETRGLRKKVGREIGDKFLRVSRCA